MTMPILIFPNWNQILHAHVGSLYVVLCTVLEQLGEGEIDHLVAFEIRKLLKSMNNYTSIEQECLAMVYALQKFCHYLLGSHFTFFIDQYVLWYLIKKSVLGGRIYH